jgi:3-oxoacyl-ACP reductase-like protein
MIDFTGQVAIVTGAGRGSIFEEAFAVRARLGVDVFAQ